MISMSGAPSPRDQDRALRMLEYLRKVRAKEREYLSVDKLLAIARERQPETTRQDIERWILWLMESKKPVVSCSQGVMYALHSSDCRECIVERLEHLQYIIAIQEDMLRAEGDMFVKPEHAEVVNAIVNKFEAVLTK